MEEIDDSKLISPTKRKIQASSILVHPDAVGVGKSSGAEIDANIYGFSFEEMKRAFMSMSKDASFLLVDGFRRNDVNYPQMILPKEDQKSVSIEAASIMEKTTRDRTMTRIDLVFEGCGLSKNKNAGTREQKPLEKQGPVATHRKNSNLEGQR